MSKCAKTDMYRRRR